MLTDILLNLAEVLFILLLSPLLTGSSERSRPGCSAARARASCSPTETSGSC